MTSSSALPLFVLFSILSLGATSGHLRLEFTASHDCDIHLTISSFSEILRLPMGSKITSSFHPSSPQLKKILMVDFKVVGGPEEDVVSEMYHLKVQEEPTVKTFVFGSVVVIVESVFECDKDFTGEHCEERVTTSSSTTTTTSTTTITSTTATEETTTASTSTTAGAPLTSSTPSFVRVPVPIASTSNTGSSSTLIVILSLVVICLAVLTVIVWILLPRGEAHIYIEPTQKCLKNPEDLYAVIQKTPKGSANGSPRYAPQPYTTILMTPC